MKNYRTKKNTKTQKILKNTLNWYLENLSPLYNEGEVGEFLRAIQGAIQKFTGTNVDVQNIVTMLGEFYIFAKERGLISNTVQFPGPGKDFKKLYDESTGKKISKEIIQEGGGELLRDYINVNGENYKVLGLLLEGMDRIWVLYDPDTRKIVSALPSPRQIGSYESGTLKSPLGSPLGSPSVSPRSMPVSPQLSGEFSPLTSPRVTPSSSPFKKRIAKKLTKTKTLKAIKIPKKISTSQYDLAPSPSNGYHQYDVIPPERSGYDDVSSLF